MIAMRSAKLAQGLPLPALPVQLEPSVTKETASLSAQLELWPVDPPASPVTLHAPAVSAVSTLVLHARVAHSNLEPAVFRAVEMDSTWILRAAARIVELDAKLAQAPPNVLPALTPDCPQSMGCAKKDALQVPPKWVTPASATSEPCIKTLVSPHAQKDSTPTTKSANPALSPVPPAHSHPPTA